MSKKVEAVTQLLAMTPEELDLHLREQRRKLFEVRFQQAAGQVEDHRQIRTLRREIARTMTIQVEVAHGHHLASEAMLEAGPEETDDREARPTRRLFRRGGRVAEEPRAEAAAAAEVAEPAVEPATPEPEDAVEAEVEESTEDGDDLDAPVADEDQESEP